MSIWPLFAFSKLNIIFFWPCKRAPKTFRGVSLAPNFFWNLDSVIIRIIFF